MASCGMTGNEFPSYVPITPYQTYSIRELKPDAAYIHIHMTAVIQ